MCITSLSVGVVSRGRETPFGASGFGGNEIIRCRSTVMVRKNAVTFSGTAFSYLTLPIFIMRMKASTPRLAWILNPLSMPFSCSKYKLENLISYDRSTVERQAIIHRTSVLVRG